jgi:hypothetical protein
VQLGDMAWRPSWALTSRTLPPSMPSTSYLESCQWLDEDGPLGHRNVLSLLTVLEVDAGQALELVLGSHAACSAGEAGLLDV